jgi:hypothetical protein
MLELVRFSLFDISHSCWSEVMSHCGFDLHFPDDEWILYHVLLTICTSSFEKWLFITSVPIFNQVICFFAFGFLEVFVYSGYQSLSDVYTANILSYFMGPHSTVDVSSVTQKLKKFFLAWCNPIHLFSLWFPVLLGRNNSLFSCSTLSNA